MTTSVIVAIAALFGNIILASVILYQFYSNKKSRDLDSFLKELDFMKSLQEQQRKTYEESLKRKDVLIENLTNLIKDLQKLIDENTAEVMKLQRIVTMLLSKGCLEATHCPNQKPYTIDDIKEAVN